ncbi:MAG: cysteine desulfurase NifS [Clostridiales bacterium]|jgi:cysteine desulfurase|nr:cysteine desulfurase NifS [Clostridiales bacterium]
MNKIYFDNAATTQVRQEVFETMSPYFTENYGNPSSIYEIARTNKKAIDTAREQIAQAIGADAAELFFTGSGTEADNWAIKGVAEAYREKGTHIITTAIEHHAVLHTCQYLETKGFEVTYLPVKENGIIDLDALKKAIRPTTILISIMFANNEIGTIQPIAEIGAVAKENGILFHTDAVQALGHVPIDVKAMHIDLLTITAHKIYGPKGIGALYIRKGVRLKPFIHGGGQERGRRAGTENVPAIVGFGKAAALIIAEMAEESERLLRLRNKLVDGVLAAIPFVWLNGDRNSRLPGNANLSFKYIEGESILLLLEMQGIFASSGSACTSGSLDPSHVLLAIGLPHEDAHGSLRLTLGRYNTEAEVDRFLTALPPIITRLRQMSPLYEG